MEVRHKVALILVARAGADREELKSRLETEARDSRAALSMSLPRSVMGESTQGASGAGLPLIDAILEISDSLGTPFATLAGGLAGFGERHAAWLDPMRASVLAGTEQIVMPGAGPVSLFCPLRRLAKLSRQEFQRYWLEVHAEFGRRPGNRYRQFHGDAEATEIVAGLTGIAACDFDGVALAYFDDVDHLRRTLASPDIAREAFADEQKFIDHARSLFLPFTAIKQRRE